MERGKSKVNTTENPKFADVPYIERVTYREYQLYRMLQTGTDLTNVDEVASNWAEDAQNDLDLLAYIEENGFVGGKKVWSEFDSFIEHEYRNHLLIEWLLSLNRETAKDDIFEYKNDIARLKSADKRKENVTNERLDTDENRDGAVSDADYGGEEVHQAEEAGN